MAPQNRILPILSLWMNTQGQGRFVIREQKPVPQVERVFILYAARSKEGATAMKTMNMISRRSFLKVAMAAATVSALGLTGCGSSASGDRKSVV